MAPELINYKNYGFKSDVWGAMVSLYALVFGFLPFYGDNFNELKHQILSYDLRHEITHEERWKCMSIGARDFFKKGFQKNPNLRPSAEQMLNHPWLKNVQLPQEALAVPKNHAETAIFLRAGISVNTQAILNLRQCLEKY